MTNEQALEILKELIEHAEKELTKECGEESE